MHRLSLLVLAFCLAVSGVALAASRQTRQQDVVSATTFVISGHGYGHGVGMGQWGAYGMAKGGATFDKILGFYYPGTQLGQSPVKSIRVLLAETAGKVTISSAQPFRLRDADGTVHQVTSGQVTVDPRLDVQLDAASGAAPQVLPGPLTLQPGRAPLVFKHPYRGFIQVQVVGTHLQVVNVIGLDAYVQGVVTGEMPHDWPAAALEAQAVAARSYAVATLGDGKILYTDQRSQVYGGLDGESPQAVQAVAATRGQVLLYQGKVATTYFSSSSGGRTTAITDLVPGAKPLPYLISKRDPYDVASPWHNWGPVVFTGAQVSKAFHVAGVTDITPVPANAHARQVVVTTAGDVQQTLGAGYLRAGLNLRSTFVKIGLLTLSRPSEPVAAGSSVTLSGTVRAVKGPVVLEQQDSPGVWSPGPALTPAADGSFSVTVTPAQTTRYRLSAPGVTGQALQVPVTGTAKMKRRLQVVRRPPHRVRHTLSGAFVATDPLASQQWYLTRDRAFDFWVEPPVLATVPVGIVDTGIDQSHPEFAGKIARARSFVGGTVDDEIGHGTFVAGEIAAALGNGQGIAGIAFPARLLVAKVVGADQTIDPAIEAKAIRWLVDRGAKIINLSLGAVRDPADHTIDTYSGVEAAAVQYAVRHGVLLVAAVGNGNDAPSTPWSYASYPAALPHVIGVGALAQDGSVPPFSNRDPVYTDLVAPGVGILSTFPRALTAQRPSCVDQGYSDCADRDYRDGDGTSFAVPQVSAAAALLLAVHPGLTPDQLESILEHSADDVSPATGCARCSVGRDSLSGWGSLDIEAALAAASAHLPPADHLEPNDDAGSAAAKIWGSSSFVRATVDYWADPVDVYAVRVAPGQQISVSLRGANAARLQLVLWKPGTRHVEGKPSWVQAHRAVEALQTGPFQRFTYRADAGGWYDVEVRETAPGSAAYTLRVSKS